MTGVFSDDRIKAVSDDFQQLLEERLGKLKMAFLPVQTPQGELPIPEARRLMQVIGMQQSIILDLRRELTLVGAVCKTLCLGLDDDQREAVIENTVAEVKRQHEKMDQQTKQQQEQEKQASTGIVLPGFNGKPRFSL